MDILVYQLRCTNDTNKSFHIIEDIYPHLNKLRSCHDLVPSHSQHIYENSPNQTFDGALETLLTSLYPMIWVGVNAVMGKAMTA
ncbi:hypothetical protein DMN91_013076 [Ooceraea biroi]|uniref:Uncharacterized protein n=1 Tax=Ooceraea biroi TaxID=2015173 RepID=A0A3L8D3A5_OOCBI|nr:hypothetical protein DMN91_013076 [Ooceraea biroi]